MSRPTHLTARASAAVRTLQWVQHGLFTLLLVIALVEVALPASGAPGWALPAGLALAAWYGLGIRLSRLASSSWVGVGWFLGLTGIWAVLAWGAPGFRWIMFALCLLAFHLVPVPGALALVVAMTGWVVRLGMVDNPGDAVGQTLAPVLGAVIAVGVVAGYGAILDESRKRLQLVEELRAAHREAELLSDELARTQRESGALAERARLARDIHDTLAQGFSSVLLLSRAGIASARRDGTDAGVLPQIEATAAENLEEARRVVHALAPTQLDDAPLPAALRRLAGTLTEHAGIEARVEVVGEARAVPTAVEVALLRLAQSALANVRQHAEAKHCFLTLGYDDGAVSLDVVDDGRGFDPDHVPASAGGFGLRAMRERVAELGGSVDIESAPGEGTAVAVHVPTKETP